MTALVDDVVSSCINMLVDDVCVCVCVLACINDASELELGIVNFDRKWPAAPRAIAKLAVERRCFVVGPGMGDGRRSRRRLSLWLAVLWEL